MDHTVFYLWEGGLDFIMSGLCNLMRFIEGLLAIGANFYIYINFVTKNSRFQLVDSQNAFLRDNQLADLFDSFIVTGMISHFIDGVSEDIDRRLEDEDADYH